MKKIIAFTLTIFLVILFIAIFYKSIKISTFVFSIASFNILLIAIYLFFLLIARNTSLLILNIILINKRSLYLGVFYILTAIYFTYFFWSDFQAGLITDSSFWDDLSMPILLWSLTINNIIISLGKVEFRDKGINFIFSFLSWKRIRKYYWMQQKPNILFIEYESRHSVLSSSTTLKIPTKYCSEVSRILEDKLPHIS